MEIIEVQPQGFCQGVAKAIRIAQQTLSQANHGPVTILGSLVHNRFVNEQLEAAGARILNDDGRSRLELLDEIDSGTVIFTAHGVSEKVRRKAAEKGLQVVDASCPFVCQTQKLIRQKADDGCTIFYVGKKGHPEAEGALEDEPGRTVLIERDEDIPDAVQGPVFVTNQTTMSAAEVDALFQSIQRRYPHAEIADELCTATRLRQQAVRSLAGDRIDLLIVIGDPRSNNTRKLADTGRQAGIEQVVCIENRDQLDLAAIASARKVALTSGASTPAFLKEEVLKALRKL